MDLTWLNGQNRQKDYPLTSPHITGMVYVDTYFNYNLAQPKDNTQTISATVGRSNEFNVNLASIGLETNYKNLIGRMWWQTGSMLSIVPDQDASARRGRNLNVSDLRNLREAAAGYHFNYKYGLNIEMGIFMSYVGLESYVTQENWCYQRAMVSEFTPFYYSGMRMQFYPSARYKTELWVMNGWQSYGKWNQAPSVGSSHSYRPTENLQLVANVYIGSDTRAQKQRLRFHHDNSVQYRYFKSDASKFGLSRAAFSINNHLGFENGGPQTDRFTAQILTDSTGRPKRLTPQQAYFLGASVANRLWFAKNVVGLTTRADVLAHGGFYASDNPGPYADRVAAYRSSNMLRMVQGTVTLDIMPSDHFTFRVEYVHRRANIPYFAGPLGTTGPSGYNDEPIPDSYVPDQQKTENRITIAVNYRI